MAVKNWPPKPYYFCMNHLLVGEIKFSMSSVEVVGKSGWWVGAEPWFDPGPSWWIFLDWHIRLHDSIILCWTLFLFFLLKWLVQNIYKRKDYLKIPSHDNWEQQHKRKIDDICFKVTGMSFYRSWEDYFFCCGVCTNCSGHNLYTNTLECLL